MKIQLKHSQQYPIRLSFPQLWQAVKVRNADGSEDDGKAQYSCNVLIVSNDPQLVTLRQIFEQVAVEQWGEKAKNVLAELNAKDQTCLHNGDFKSAYDGYPGHWYLTCRSPTAPLVLGRSKEMLTETSGRPYGGCYVNLSVDVYAQDHRQWGKRINARLRGVQFVEDGEAFAGGPPADPEEFDNLETGEAAEAPLA
jgi:Protein of unknown function (DUF2815)